MTLIRRRKPELTCRLPLRPALLLLALGAAACHVALAARHVREKVRLAEPTGEVNPRVDRVDFDPLIAELEQEQDDKAWMENYSRSRDMWTEGQPGGEAELQGEDEEDFEFDGGDGDAESRLEAMEQLLEEALEDDLADLGQGDPQDFLDESHFNISDRIIKLFPLIDSAPSDGRISLEELTAWHVRIGQQGSMHRTVREMEAADADGDRHATLQEALVAAGAGDPGDESTRDQRESSIERFHISDRDKDNLLNITEFHDFLHPEESDNEDLHRSLVRDEMRHRDMDGDGKLNVHEFEMTTHHEVQHLMSEEDKEPHQTFQEHFDFELGEDPEHIKRKHEREVQGSFDGLDRDGDGLIDADEFRPILKAVWPSQRDFAEIHSKEVSKQADGNEDGYLTLKEMLDHPHAFYQTVEDQHPMHDEF